MSDIYPCDKCGQPTHPDDLDAKDDGTGNYTILECGDCYGPGYCTVEGWKEMGARTHRHRALVSRGAKEANGGQK